MVGTPAATATVQARNNPPAMISAANTPCHCFWLSGTAPIAWSMIEDDVFFAALALRRVFLRRAVVRAGAGLRLTLAMGGLL